MNLPSGNLFCKVGVQFDQRGAGLAVWRRLHGRSFTYEALADNEDFGETLLKLVIREGVAGARCVVSLPVALCRIRWVSLAGVRWRDLRAVVNRSAFWQARMGVTRNSHCLWWQFVRDRDGSAVNVLMIAAPRGKVESCIDTIRKARLEVSRVGVSCFDYIDDAGISLDTSGVTLILDCDDACAVSSGAFGVRVTSVEFNESSAGDLLSADSRTRGGIIDNLATCVRRCVEDEQSAARLRASVRIVTARDLHGDWLELLQERLPGLRIEWVDGWTMTGIDQPRQGSSGNRWRLPRALSALEQDLRRGSGLARHRFLPKVNLVDRANSRARVRRYLLFALPSSACLLFVVLIYAYWSLHEKQLALQPGAQRHEHLTQLYEETLGKIQSLQELLSHRVLFYSVIQRISFERKLMPHLLTSIEKSTFSGIWLDEIHFKRPALFRITGKSLGDEQISRFMRRLRSTDEVVEVLLESASTESVQDAPPQRLKNFAVICQLRFTQQEI